MQMVPGGWRLALKQQEGTWCSKKSAYHQLENNYKHAQCTLLAIFWTD